MKGITEEQFNPLKAFKEANKKVPELCWTLPEADALRNEFIQFLDWNKTESLKI